MSETQNKRPKIFCKHQIAGAKTGMGSVDDPCPTLSAMSEQKKSRQSSIITSVSSSKGTAKTGTGESESASTSMTSARLPRSSSLTSSPGCISARGASSGSSCVSCKGGGTIGLFELVATSRGFVLEGRRTLLAKWA